MTFVLAPQGGALLTLGMAVLPWKNLCLVSQSREVEDTLLLPTCCVQAQ